MQRLLPIICIVAGLAAGTVAGLFIWSPETPVPGPGADPSWTDEPQAQQAPRVGRPAPAGQAASTQTLLAGIEAPRARGDGAIEGVVKYDEGGPVAGVEIRATPLLAAVEDVAAADRLEAFVRRRVAERALQVAAKTGPDGKYRLGGLDADKLYHLAPTLAGHGFRPAWGVGIKHYRTGTSAGFIATRRLGLRLRFPDGGEPDWAYVEVTPDGKEDRSLNRSWHWTCDEPFVPVRPGRWKITAKAGDWQEFSGETVWDAENPGDALAIELKQRSGIVGTVVPLAGQVERLQLVMVREADGKFPVVDRPHGIGGRSTTTVFNVYSGFNFGFFDLEPGRYRLSLFFGDRPVLTHDQTVANDLTTLRLVVPEPDAKDFIVVRVTGPDGPVTEGVMLNLIYAHANDSEGGGAVSLSRGNGEYWVPRNDARLRQPGGFYQLGVRTAFGGRTLRYEQTDTHVLDVVFAAPATIVVEIVGFEAFGRKDALRVSYSSRGDAGGGESRRNARDEGGGATRRFPTLIPGRYEVALILDIRGASYNTVLDRKTVDVVSGDNRIQLTAPTLYAITVVVPEEYRTQQIGIYSVNESGMQWHQPKTGVEEQVFEDLVAGEYRLQSYLGVMKLSVPLAPGQKVTFAPLPFNAYRLVTGYQPATVDLGLKEGDFVIEVDGKPLEGEANKWELISGAQARESTTWKVLRSGVQLSVTFDGRKWVNSGLRTELARTD